MKNYTVEVAIPALNEEQNIKQLIENLLRQNQTGFKLSAITVYSDGSDDQTVDVVKSFKHKKVRVVAGKKRLGKYKRLNDAYKNLQADVLVVFDGDVLPADTNVLFNLIQEFRQSDKVGLVGGNPQPISSQTLVEAAVNSMFKSREVFKRVKHNGHNVYGLWGCCLAVSKKFAHELVLPKNAPDDAFTYFACITKDYLFRHSASAKVWFRSPQTMKDQITQGIRFSRNHNTLEHYFERDFILAEYDVPNSVKLQSLVTQVLRNPIGYLLMKYMHMQVMKAAMKKYQPLWDQVLSTKQITIQQV